MPGLSLREASAIADVPESTIRKALEARVISPTFRGSGRGRRYGFHGRDLLYLKLLRASPIPFSPADKRALWELIGARKTRVGPWRREGSDFVVEAPDHDVRVHIETKRLRSALGLRLRAFARGQRRIVEDPNVLGGEPVFAGTRIPLAHIAELFRKGTPLEELREDYPSLTDADLLYASILGRMKPAPGRPPGRLKLLREGVPVETEDLRFAARAAAH